MDRRRRGAVICAPRACRHAGLLERRVRGADPRWARRRAAQQVECGLRRSGVEPSQPSLARARCCGAHCVDCACTARYGGTITAHAGGSGVHISNSSTLLTGCGNRSCEHASQRPQSAALLHGARGSPARRRGWRACRRRGQQHCHLDGCDCCTVRGCGWARAPALQSGAAVRRAGARTFSRAAAAAAAACAVVSPRGSPTAARTDSGGRVCRSAVHGPEPRVSVAARGAWGLDGRPARRQPHHPQGGEPAGACSA